MKVRFYIDPTTGLPHIYNHQVDETEVKDVLANSAEDRPGAPEEKAQMKKLNRFPKGWNEARVRKVLDHYESQTEEEVVAEDEAAFHKRNYTVMVVPKGLVPAITRLVAREKAAASRARHNKGERD